MTALKQKQTEELIRKLLGPNAKIDAKQLRHDAKDLLSLATQQLREPLKYQASRVQVNTLGQPLNLQACEQFASQLLMIANA
jgi:hypothetical protein